LTNPLAPESLPQTATIRLTRRGLVLAAGVLALTIDNAGGNVDVLVGQLEQDTART
jgi:hypothetical protein